MALSQALNKCYIYKDIKFKKKGKGATIADVRKM